MSYVIEVRKRFPTPEGCSELAGDMPKVVRDRHNGILYPCLGISERDNDYLKVVKNGVLILEHPIWYVRDNTISH